MKKQAKIIVKYLEEYTALIKSGHSINKIGPTRKADPIEDNNPQSTPKDTMFSTRCTEDQKKLLQRLGLKGILRLIGKRKPCPRCKGTGLLDG